MEIFTKNSAKCTIFQSTNCNNFSSLMNPWLWLLLPLHHVPLSCMQLLALLPLPSISSPAPFSHAPLSLAKKRFVVHGFQNINSHESVPSHFIFHIFIFFSTMNHDDGGSIQSITFIHWNLLCLLLTTLECIFCRTTRHFY
jgi:hypothetical protein